MGLEGRNAIVTGGASGMGLATALRLARDGADVAVFDLDAAGAERAAKQIGDLGRRGLACGVDVSERSAVDAAVTRVRGQLGPVHILVNNAGIAEFIPFVDLAEENWDHVMAVNLRGTFLCTKAVVQGMIEAHWGRIINISSSSAQSGAPLMTHYAASKAGIIGFTKALALELGPHGITVNAVPPGSIDTPMLRKTLGSPEPLAKVTPVGRVGQPEDIAAACAFLASEEAGYVTGHVLSVNGGRYM